MTVQVEPFPNPDRHICRHPRCDGRPAKWLLPQTKNVPHGPMVCCGVHLARFVEIALEMIAEKQISTAAP
jgi:hypothetical protein